MQGAEYLSEAALVGVWEDLDAWVRGAVAAGGEGLSGFLKRRAPLWHQVGRVCFHLAENRRDRGLSLRLSGDLRAERGGRRPRAVSAAEPGPAASSPAPRTRRRWCGCSRRCIWRRNRAPWSRNWSTRATSTSRWPGRPARPIAS